MKTNKNSLTEKLPEWAMFFGSLIVSQPPKGWFCEKEIRCKSPEYLFEPDTTYDSGKIKFVPVDRKPYLGFNVPAGEREYESYLVFKNIEPDVEKFEREFNARCGL
ncbi:MAG: hypothetical protein PHO02_03700 [Candidatus Nanoarchaeia archaeon]|nr:hypothetical protein [Candidatus Nanoarchaeia archaeon]